MPITIIDFLSDKRLFGGHPAFADPTTWKAWRVFLRCAYGLELQPGELEIYRRHTGRRDPPPAGGFREVVAICGRQSGKSTVAAALATFEAVTAPPQRDRTQLVASLMSQDALASQRVLFSYVRSLLLASPLLREEIEAERVEGLVLRNGMAINTMPCRPEALRGLRCRIIVLDELSFYRSSDLRPLDREALRAARPALFSTGGRLIVLSSPGAPSGALFDLDRRHFGQDGSPVLIWRASSMSMNPVLEQCRLDALRIEDPEAYRSEVLGEFRSSGAALFDAEALDRVVAPGRRELAPRPAVQYFGFADPSSGGGQDSFTLTIGHAAGEDVRPGRRRSVLEPGRMGFHGLAAPPPDETHSGPWRAVVDALRVWSPPFSPAATVAEAAALLKRYGISRVTGDRYAGALIPEMFAKEGIVYEPSELSKSEIYVEALACVNSGRAELLDNADCLTQMRALVRRTAFGGARDRIDHPPQGHDDLANAICGLLALVEAEAGAGPHGGIACGASFWEALENLARAE